MAIDTTAGSPGFWLLRLGNRLANDAARLDKLYRYYDGDHPLPEGHRRQKAVFRQLQRQARSNYTALVVEALNERLHIDGFRAGTGATVTDDAAAWRRWQANSLDADSEQVHVDALIAGRSYAIVGVNDDDRTTPLITPEDPREVIHEADPVRRRTVRAALKTWVDDVSKERHAVVYLDNVISYYVAPAKSKQWTADVWTLDLDEGDDGEADNPFGEVPVVPFINRLRGKGEFEDVTDVQDRINNTILDRLVTQKAQAYRQRWAKGVKTEDENGNPVPFEAGADLLWAVENDSAQFGDFQQSDITQLLKAADADIRDLAAISRTPAHYLLAEMTNIGAEALLAADIGLVAKALARQRHFGESWEKVQQLAAVAAGEDPRPDGEVVWRDPQYRTIAELYDAASKASGAGVPWRDRMELLGKTPQQIDAMEANRTADALLLAQFPQLEPPGTPVRYTDTMHAPVPDAPNSSNGNQPQPPAGR